MKLEKNNLEELTMNLNPDGIETGGEGSGGNQEGGDREKKV